MDTSILLFLVFLTLLVIGAVGASLWKRCNRSVIVWDYQTALHYKDGKFVRTLDSGKHRLWGAGHAVVVYEDRVMELVVQSQELITADSATLKLSAVARYRIEDARRFHEASEDSRQALYTQVQLALREVFGTLGGEIKAAMVSVLTARKEAQAKQERARGEAAALRAMANAARVCENNPELLRLRYLETLKEIGAGHGNSLFIGVPQELASLAVATSNK